MLSYYFSFFLTLNVCHNNRRKPSPSFYNYTTDSKHYKSSFILPILEPNVIPPEPNLDVLVDIYNR